MGIEPTGNTVDATAFAMHRVTDGKVLERWVLFDALGVIEQLGPMPNA